MEPRLLAQVTVASVRQESRAMPRIADARHTHEPPRPSPLSNVGVVSPDSMISTKLGMANTETGFGSAFVTICDLVLERACKI